MEMNNLQARPALKDTKVDVSACAILFIGYPVWWNQAPRIVNTFIESHDLNGKTLVPFATSGGSGIAGSAKALRESYPDLKWQEGKLLNGANRNAISLYAQPSDSPAGTQTVRQASQRTIPKTGKQVYIGNGMESKTECTMKWF